ncbi:DUF2264 domain-containing protein [Nonomuraea rosea]|uniref:DUF2264 domain-containing protein n=1 Tax=Nonomuraea rosea TaxID=638574 RepID=A0ABP6ZJG6_9ACTN
MNRDAWERVADDLLRAAWRWASPDQAFLHLPGKPSANGVLSDGLEGYARTFLAAAFRVAGAEGDDPHGWLDRYASGLAAGPRLWPAIGDYYGQGQPMVESASVALGLRLTRPWLWDRLDPDVQDQAETWLRGALRHLPSPNNWYLFPLTVAGFLESVGRGDEETARARQRALDLLDHWYQGQGWYSDGDGRAFDHYNGWALHLYPMLDSPDVFGERLREHLESYALLFGGDGAPIHFGRSLTYRFAAAGAVALGAVTGHTPLSPGASRRLINGCLRYFLDRGAVDSDGLLVPGWHGPHEPTLQFYSGPASPYWASKAFVALLAPAGHPLWTAPEEPVPNEIGDRVLALPGPGLLIQSTRADGIVRLHNHGSDHVRPHEAETADGDDPHYGRLAYSTRTGPTALGNVADNHLGIEFSGSTSVRRRIHPLGDGWGWAASWHRPVFPTGSPMLPGLRVESVTIVRGPLEVRVHRIVGAPTGTRVTETGWASDFSDIQSLYGWAERDNIPAPYGTAFTRSARVPRLAADITGTRILASLVSLTTEPVPSSAVAFHADGDTLTIRWTADGFATSIAFDPLQVIA